MIADASPDRTKTRSIYGRWWRYSIPGNALLSGGIAVLGFALAHLGIRRRARTTSRQKIIFSILVLVVLVPAAVLGALSVAAAVLAHELSELLAVANGLRVLRG